MADVMSDCQNDLPAGCWKIGPSPPTGDTKYCLMSSLFVEYNMKGEKKKGGKFLRKKKKE
jgi:hypothetical protein